MILPGMRMCGTKRIQSFRVKGYIFTMYDARRLQHKSFFIVKTIQVLQFSKYATKNDLPLW